MEYKLQELMDIPLVQQLQDDLHAIYSFPSALIDRDGNVLTASGWQDDAGPDHHAIPILAEGEHVATFLTHPEALSKVPGLTAEQLGKHLSLIKTVAEILTVMVTGQLREKRAGRVSEARYRRMFENVQDVYYEATSEGLILEVSPSIELISKGQYRREDLIGRLMVDFYAIPEERVRFSEAIRHSGSVTDFELSLKNKDGTTIPCAISSKLLFDKQGLPELIIGSMRDISRRKATEAELIHTKEKAEETSRLKSSLLMNMSHELRTPLNGILGFAGLLGASLQDEESKNMADIITISGKRLMGTLNSIMELAQVEADRQQINLEVLDMGKVASGVLKKHETLFSQKKIQLLESIEKGICANLDPALLGNIIFHLTDNAVKFTEAGSVSVIVKKERHDGTSWAVLKVRDTGHGITQAQLGYIFEAFRQGDEGIGRSHEGTGLGLTLCKKFTALMGGVIEVESKVGAGSTFIVRFPLAEGKPQEITGPEEAFAGVAEDPASDAFKPRILIVEDNLNNAELVTIYLKDKFIPDSAYSGRQAVKMAYLNDYDIILMDINLGPEMDGITATREIRAIERYASKPVIAVTGYSTPEEKKFILGQGFTEFITKPFDKAGLLEVIKKATRGK